MVTGAAGQAGAETGGVTIGPYALVSTAQVQALVEQWRDLLEQLLRESASQRDKQRVIYCEGKAMSLKYCADDLARLIAEPQTGAEHGSK